MSHRLLPRNPRRHLGTFEGEALRRAGGFSPSVDRDGTIGRDLASAIAMIAFVGSVAVVLAAILHVGAPI